jgi:AcrR family transcriptional regulator
MSVRERRRQAALQAMADHLLEHGLPGATLRPLAEAAGASDRMLLYYFANKEELIGATLSEVAARLARELDAAVPPGPRPFEVALAETWRAFRSQNMARYMRLWLDIAAAAARGQEPYRSVAGQIADGFLVWAGSRLAADDEDQRAGVAARLVAAFDGLALLEAVGRGAAADAAVAIGPGASR